MKVVGSGVLLVTMLFLNGGLNISQELSVTSDAAGSMKIDIALAEAAQGERHLPAHPTVPGDHHPQSALRVTRRL